MLSQVFCKVEQKQYTLRKMTIKKHNKDNSNDPKFSAERQAGAYSVVLDQTAPSGAV